VASQEVIAHDPLVQAMEAWGTAAHALGHDPQWLRSLVRLISQPFAALLSQLAKPPKQVMPHWPVAHDGVPFVALQGELQAPQCAGSVFRLISQPSATLLLQLAKFVVQAMLHVPPVQVGTPLLALHG
jgi:hypothetical protein